MRLARHAPCEHAVDAISRLSAMCLMPARPAMNVLVDMISSAVNLFIQISALPTQAPRYYITECVGRDGTKILTKDIYRFVQTWMDEKGVSYGYFTGWISSALLRGDQAQGPPDSEGSVHERAHEEEERPAERDRRHAEGGLQVPDDAEAVAFSHGSGGIK